MPHLLLNFTITITYESVSAFSVPGTVDALLAHGKVNTSSAFRLAAPWLVNFSSAPELTNA